jgi:putative transposase
VARRQRDKDAGLFHVWCHSVWSAELYRDDLDRSRFVTELARITQRTGWRCIASCLLTTHYHLLVEVENDVLPGAMQALNFRYASGFNSRHRLRGHVVGGRYGSRRVVGEADLRDTYRYLARNPVEAGLCASPVQWRWSSYPGAVGCAEPLTFVDPSVVLGCFGSSPQAATFELRRFVEKA